jgi:hypothetical protein
MDDKQISQLAIEFQQWVLSLCEQDKAIEEAQKIIDAKD